MEHTVNNIKDPLPLKTLMVVFSYHHKNTEKIANVFAKVLDAQIKTPRQVHPEELQAYDLIGFGSGIYSAKHHTDLLDLADTLPRVNGKKVFIFSTSAIMGKEKVAKDHSMLREKLQSKGYVIVDEFSCKGFNTITSTRPHIRIQSEHSSRSRLDSLSHNHFLPDRTALLF